MMSTYRSRPILTALALAGAVLLLAPAISAQTGVVDPEARALAESVMDRMGGQAAWDGTRYLSWRFFGNRQHYWDKWSGDIRVESPEGQGRDGQRRPATLVLMNLNTREGQAWIDGEPVTEPERLGEMIEGGWRAWVNDSYWMFMPYKLLDPGVNLRYVGEDLIAEDREADVLEMTFESVGVTPQNRYLIFIARDSGLVEQWSHFTDRDDPEPRFTSPWAGWQRFGNIMLATDKGRGAEWDIHVYDTLSASVFSDPAPVQ